MGRCHSCGEEVPETARFCLACGAPLNAEPAVTADFHAPQPSPAPVQKAASKLRMSGTGTATSSGLSSAGRFLPGTVLAERYRIVAALGKGGMGEVYRADDLILEQSVALKFLPESVDKDDDARERFRNEIRVARRVSHPNVCRVYDVGEVEGHTFLSMEYLDGEDLASLLRRIGRLVGDKAVEISRQLCAGLAAAHREGVLHRDLKPANIMLDGRGRVVVTDFGLASLADRIEGFEARNGTPAYMAPEQLAGREATVSSDIYSLGLVLYEIFTGKRAFAAETLADLIKQRNQQPPSTPSTGVKDLDPAVERVILRCLDSDPAKRPSGALAVAAALPGGDPLAAALAAGETPSPQMVAAAGETVGLAPRWAVASLAGVVVGLALVFFLSVKISGLELMRGLLPPQVLQQKAREFIDQFGYSSDAVDHAAMYDYDTDFTDYVHEHAKPKPDWPRVMTERPQVLRYLYRQSPMYLSPKRFSMLTMPGAPTFDDPPPIQSGMINLILDTRGRLSYFQAIPDEIQSDTSREQPVDWKPLFTAAGLDPAQFQSSAPTHLSLAAFDQRAAWTGKWPGTDFPLVVEAVAWRGKPVYFELLGPWSKPSRSQHESQTPGQYASQVTGVILAILFLTVGALIARRNYAQGKSDVRGAFRLAAVVFAVQMVLWLCVNHYVPTLETFGHLVDALGSSLFLAAATWLLYVSLEPYVRRRWPHAIISWSRLLGGEWRDPLVGRDLLWGILLGVFWSLIVQVGYLFLKREGATPPLTTTELLLGTRDVIGLWMQNILQSIFGTLEFFFLIFLLRVILRNQWVAIVFFIAIPTVLNTLQSDHPQIMWPFWLMVYSVAAFSVSRFGLIVLGTAIFTANALLNLPYTLNFSSWYAAHTVGVLASLLALACWGFYSSLGGQKIWKDELLD
jgi:serine/threonine-protein kinase